MKPVMVYTRAVAKWGTRAQLGMAQEECAELIVAINKLGRSGTEDGKQAVYEEIADVEIMMGQMRVLFGDKGSLDIDRIKREKLERLERMLDS